MIIFHFFGIVNVNEEFEDSKRLSAIAISIKTAKFHLKPFPMNSIRKFQMQIDNLHSFLLLYNISRIRRKFNLYKFYYIQ